MKPGMLPALMLAWLSATAGQLLAQNATWVAPGGGAWNNNANWSPATFPNGVNASATLGNATTASSTITLGQVITLGALQIDDNNNNTISSSSPSHQLVFDAGAANATLTITNANGNGSTAISSPIVLNSNLVVAQGSSGGLTISGNRTGTGGFTKEGSGMMQFTGNSTYTGPTAINDGRLRSWTAGGLPGGVGSPVVAIGDGLGVADSAVLDLRGSMGVSNAIAVNVASDGRLEQFNYIHVRLLSAAGTGEIRLNTSVGNSLEFLGSGAAYDSTFAGQITGGMTTTGVPDPNPAPTPSSRINKTGTSTLTLSGANSYLSRTFISNGAINAASNTALGSSLTNQGTYVYSSGSLQVSNNVTLAEPLFLNGTGFGGNGALRSLSGNNTLSGPLAFGWSGTGVPAAPTAVSVDAGSTLTISGSITGSANATKLGNGTLRLTGSNTYSGATSVNGGTLQLASSGTAIAGSSLTVNSGGTLLLGASNQISNSSNLTLAGGTFSTGPGYSEQLGTLTLSANSTISLGAGVHNLMFGASNLALWSPTAILSIAGWLGDPMGGTAGRIFFGSNASGLTLDQLSRVEFIGPGYTGAQLLATGELVPMAVPEAETVFSAALLLTVILWRERGRLRRLLRAPIPHP